METQKARLLKWLEDGNKVQPFTSWRQLGIYRLASRIHDLRDDGHPIDDEWIEVFNRWGEKTRVKEYFLVTNK